MQLEAAIPLVPAFSPGAEGEASVRFLAVTKGQTLPSAETVLPLLARERQGEVEAPTK